MNHLRFASIAMAALLTGAAPALADAPTLLGAFKEWSAYTTGSGKSKVCYALSQPKSSDPKKAARDPIYFLISDWPGRNAKAEPEVVPGYEYKEGSLVNVRIGSDKFELFTKNDGDTGGAWVQDVGTVGRLIDSMKRGSQLIVTGTSERGTLTKDTYSLAGISAALDKIHSSCGM